MIGGPTKPEDISKRKRGEYLRHILYGGFITYMEVSSPIKFSETDDNEDLKATPGTNRQSAFSAKGNPKKELGIRQVSDVPKCRHIIRIW